MFWRNRVIAEHKFTYPAKPVYVHEIKEKITDICKDGGFIYKDLNNLMVVIDEACSNIIRHAYRESEGDIDFEVSVREKGIYLVIIDHGKSFDFHAIRVPNLNKYVEIGKKGGLGVWIIRKLTDKSDYRVTPRGNELHLVKYHTRPSVVERLVNLIASARGIKEKFILAATALIMILVMGTYFYFVTHENAVLKDKFIEYNADIVESIAQSGKDKIIQGNHLYLIKLLNQMKSNNKGIEEAFITDGRGRIIAHNDSSRLYGTYSPGGKVFSLGTIRTAMVLRYQEGRDYRYHMVNPVVFRGEDIGEVHLVLSRQGMDRVLSGKGTNIFLIGLIVFVISAFGIYSLLTLILKPLESLREGVLAIGEGRLDHRIELDGQDEFSQIANAFNDMAKKFRGAQESIIEQEKFQKEIQVAKEIQHTLLPKNIPDTGGYDIASLYRSAKEVGGDYYDIIRVAPQQTGVIVADVSGKGVPGSLVMTIIRTAIRLVSFANRSAKSVLVKVNDFVKEDMKKGMFVTAFYLVLDSLTRKINFVSAGHDALILYRAREDKVYYIKPKGFPLGINLPDDELFRKVMVEESVSLQKDDLMVVYTDGVTEAMNGRREQWGEKRFVEVIKKYGRMTSAEFIDNLDRELKDFTQGYPQNDDITIVVIKEKKTETAALKSVERQIMKMKKKRMSSREIQKKLGVDLRMLRKIKQKKKEEGREAGRIVFLTFEQKKELMRLVIDNPSLNCAAYAGAMTEKYKAEVPEKLVRSELKRVNLLTAARRKEYSSERKR